MIESKTWYAVSKPNGGRPHSWLYAIRIAEDPWGIGSYRWDTQATDLDRPWRGEYEKINDRLHRITLNEPLGNSEEYELRPLDEDWISHHASGFTARPLMTPAGEIVREHPSLEWVRNWLDYSYGNRIAWRETQLALMESRRQYLTEAMVETFIRECSQYDFRGLTKAAIFAEPEGVMLDPPWAVRYSIKELAGEHRMQVLISNRFTNDHEFTITQNGILDAIPANKQGAGNNIHSKPLENSGDFVTPIVKRHDTMNDDTDSVLTALRKELERHFASGTPLEIIYFGGGLPGKSRTITPLRYCEKRGPDYIIALCHRSGIGKTFRLDRMHLPGPPLADGRNDFRIIAKCLGKPGFIEGMLAQIARLGNLPIEEALAKHFDQHGEFGSFFDEYPYGGYTLELSITSSVIYLSIGYEANDCDVMHYEFTPECEPRLTPGIATHYSLYV
jgi:hypothetical protein